VSELEDTALSGGAGTPNFPPTRVLQPFKRKALPSKLVKQNLTVR
jgi:hypothetical protein